MIKIKLSNLMGEKKLTQKDVSIGASIRPNTVSDLYYERVKTISIEHLNNLCIFLNCSISDLIEFIPD